MDNFICNCQSWWRSQFFICKHLVHTIQVPQYHQVTIRRQPPCITIDNSSTAVKMNIDDEEMRTPMVYNVNEEGNMGVIDENNILPILESNDLQNETVYDKFIDLVDNFKIHIMELNTRSPNNNQLRDCFENVCPRLITYMNNVHIHLHKRKNPGTYNNIDTLYLK